MASHISFVLALVSVASLLSFSAASAAEPVKISVKFKVGDVSVPVHLTCSVDSGRSTLFEKDFHQGDTFRYQVPPYKYLFCPSSWSPSNFAPVSLFSPARDKGHATMYWVVDEKGWSLSRDGKKYSLDTPWETD